MFSLRYIVAAAVPFLTLGLAQSVAFTSTPAIVQAGTSYNITWGGGDGSKVTLTLREGNPQDLRTVATIADGVSGTSYTWDAPSTLTNGVDYAFQITQGQSDINYSGQFAIQGGSGSVSSSSSSSSASATTTGSRNSTMSITSMASASGTGTAMARNSTFSTATLSSSNSMTFGQTTTGRSSSSATSGSTSATSAPSNDAPLRTGSSAALILGIVAAVMLH